MQHNVFNPQNLYKALQNPARAMAFVKYKALSSFGSRNYTKFIVLTRSRTGSNLLLSLLNSHPNIKVEGEVFSRLGGRQYQSVLANIFCKHPHFVHARGFKLFYYHPNDEDCEGLWQTLTQMDNLRIIHLKRENILRVLISRKIAGIQDKWTQNMGESGNKPHKKNKSVEFTIEELLEGFESTRKWEIDGDDMFSDHPVLEVQYENLINHREQTFNRVTDFLEVGNIEPETNLVKQNPERLGDLIDNYDELKKAFAGTAWEKFFDE